MSAGTTDNAEAPTLVAATPRGVSAFVEAAFKSVSGCQKRQKLYQRFFEELRVTAASNNEYDIFEEQQLKLISSRFRGDQIGVKKSRIAAARAEFANSWRSRWLLAQHTLAKV